MPTISFQQGVGGYAGTQDTTLRQSAASTNLGNATSLFVDSDTPSGTGQDDQVLLRFDNLFGTGAIPSGAVITKATLSLQTTNGSAQGGTLHRMLTGWSEASTWSSLGSGVQANGSEAVAAADWVTGPTAVGVTNLDVTASVQAWAGGATNNGWAFLPSGSDGWDFLSSEGSTRPKLTIEYTTSTTPPPTNTAPVVSTGTGSLSYTENAPAAAVAPGLTITDDGTSLAGATVKISTGYASGQDSLVFTTQNGIAGTWSAATGTLTLAGAATVAQYQAALASVKYVNASDNPSGAARTVEFQVNDGASINNLSTVASRTVQVTPVNDAPVANPESYTTSQNTALTIAAAGVLANDTDVDSPTRTAVLVTGPANGSLTLNPNGSFTYTPNSGFSGSDSFTYKANDGTDDGNTATVSLTITPTSTGGGETRTISFQQGVGGYAGTQDTTLRQSAASTNLGNATSLFVDSDTPSGTGQDDQVLLRFDNLFGTGAIPSGAVITKATLSLQTTNGSAQGGTLHRMLTGWSEASTWSSLGSGVQANGSEAVAAADWVTGPTAVGVTNLDVTASVQAWAGGATNNGWAFLPSGSDGWDFLSSEGSTRPKLTIEYTTATTPTNTAPVAANDSATTAENTPVTIAVLSNDTDADGDTLSISGIGTSPVHGTATINSNGTITYTPSSGYSGSDSFTYKVSDGATTSNTATVNLTVNAATSDRPFSESYIATTFPGGRQRVLEHDNATKSFYVDGDWYAVLPDGAKWYVERFDGPTPAAGQQGGWTKASTDKFLDNNRASDIAWDSATQKLYVLQYWETSSKPAMFKLDYDPATRSFVQEAEAQIAGGGGKLASTHWSSNKELVIGMDQFGTPLVANVGTATSGANQGIHLAWASKDLTTWAETTIDPVPTAAGDNSKVDIVSFENGGQKYIGLAYSADSPSTSGITGDVWKFAWHVASDNPADYATGWQIETITSTVAIDNHLSVAWDGSNIFIAMKDDKNAVWLAKGLPGSMGSWETVKAVDGDSGSVSGPSRPTLVVDHANDSLHLFYQQFTNAPYGDIYTKSVSLDGAFTFDPTNRGTPVMKTTNGTALTDPQPPVHAVDASMDGGFYMVASNVNAREIWYNQINLGSPELLV